MRSVETNSLRAWRLRDAAGQRLRDSMAQASQLKCPMEYGEAMRLARGEYSSWLVRIELALQSERV
jgi:hypothetical protein